MSGGSPWRFVRLSAAASNFLRRVRAAGPRGLVPGESDRAAVSALVARGIVHPLPSARTGDHDVRIVIPAFGRPEALARCLDRLTGLDVVVVDDATPNGDSMRSVAESRGVSYVRLPVNVGPGAARNAGMVSTHAAFVAFVDSDCQPTRGWLDALVPHFDDPRVGAVAPRIRPTTAGATLLERFEGMSSALDMGDRPALVRPGAALGFLPSATLVVRRVALEDGGFDERLRLGEDVDLVWRLADAGWLVRYDPSVVVTHEMRDTWQEWVNRRYEYGTSAASLELRHPGRLSPVRLSALNAASLGLIVAGKPVVAAALSGAAAALLARRLRAKGGTIAMAVSLVARGLLADGTAVGHALRREYWPVGVLAMAAAPWSRPARVAVGLMIGPVIWDWGRGTHALDPVRYSAARLLADAAYGTGVQASAWRARTPSPLVPTLRNLDRLDPRKLWGGGRRSPAPRSEPRTSSR